MNKIIKNTIILTIITLVSGVALGAVYEITKAPIANAQEEAKQEAYKQVFEDADSFDDLEVDAKEAAEAVKAAGVDDGAEINEAVEAKQGGETIGYVITATDPNGYGGDIQVSVGIQNDGTVNGIAILSINETAGLGMKASEQEFYEQYSGKQTDHFYVSKDGGEGEQIDAISGATITTRAVTGAVNASLGYYQNVLGGSADE
ncbi:RnfABCDGE type electron transport complex subunit G [Sellimonas catena]|uniref:Ion-translocating oxidoreductase complex subunit G n=1 Tax=Sellimonas catena TaxID=2994035 RepID=A0A9W6CBU5_9FIRM|nr:RnfABCDGE type electron transport complex subunit G [Sellimonas catena]GLG05905.1 electron transport complex subunit G [Sellimonas catena]GLG91233.1 electron transport complex subunit G [Sellimonas catena]